MVSLSVFVFLVEIPSCCYIPFPLPFENYALDPVPKVIHKHLASAFLTPHKYTSANLQPRLNIET